MVIGGDGPHGVNAVWVVVLAVEQEHDIVTILAPMLEVGNVEETRKALANVKEKGVV